MKSKILLGFLALLSAGVLFAAESAGSCGGGAKCPVKEWTAFQLGIFPGVPTVGPEQGVAGIKVGAPFSIGQATVCGLDASFFGSSARRVEGVQISSAVAMADTVAGVQIAPVNMADRCAGLQFGVLNMAKSGAVQVGLLNFIENSPLPFMILVNVGFTSKECRK